MAVSGHNGNNETLIGMSFSHGLSIYDENNNELQVSQIKSPIEFFIKRDSNLPSYKYQYVNATQINFMTIGSEFLSNYFNITSLNSSVHIQLEPVSSNVAYLIVTKFGYLPVINSTYADYDSFEIMCPSKYEFRFSVNLQIKFF